jgi:IS605 OrfB family transposase
MTCYDNNNQRCFIIDGGQYLSINRYFDKKIKHYQSIVNAQGKKTSKRIKQLYSKRRKQLFHLIHAASKKITDYCIANDITRVIVGDIKGIRDNSNLGQQNNQKLHKLPYEIICNQLEYKLKLKGIPLIKQNEAYTSRCSPYSPDICKKYEAGKNRIYRGLYIVKEKKRIFNADGVGAYNILRKYLQKKKKKLNLNPEGLNEVTKHKWNKHCFCA